MYTLQPVDQMPASNPEIENFRKRDYRVINFRELLQ